MDIVLHNIQVIRDAKFNLPDTGIVEFVGDNSNGKSVLEKVISSIVKLDILDEDTRKTLISDGETSGYVVMVKGKKSLSVLLDHMRDKTILQYSPNIEDQSLTITRTLREGGLKELIYEFGWRVYDNNSLCLQIYPTFGAMPFINTSYTANAEITEDVTRDRIADKFLDNYANITFPLAQRTIKTLKGTKNTLEAQISSTRTYDYVRYEALAERIGRCKDFFEHWEHIELPEIQLPPDVTFADIPEITLREIPIINFMEDDMDLDDMSEQLDKLLSILDGVCPTCGKAFLEEGHNHV